MTENASVSKWIDPDDAPELDDEFFEKAGIFHNGVLVRAPTGKWTGRPSLGDKARQSVTMRLPPHVLSYFRGTGPGWQRQVSDILENYVAGQKA